MSKPGVRRRIIERGLLVTHGEDGFVLPNAKIAAIADKLVGEIDGRRTTTELADALPERVRPLMSTILKQMAERGMLVEAPRGLVSADLVASDAGLLALTVGGDWEGNLRAWTETEMIVSGPDADEADGVARQLVQAGGCVAARRSSKRIEIRAAGRLTVIAAEVHVGTIIGTAIPGREADWPGTKTLLTLDDAEECHRTEAQRMIVFATTARYALLAALAASTIARKMILVDNRGLSTEFESSADNAIGIPPSGQWDPLADTAVWLDDAGPLAAGRDVDPAFPLSHRMIELKDRDEPARTIIEWGLNPREADERAQVSALAELAAAARPEGDITKREHRLMKDVALEDLDGRAAVLWRISEAYGGHLLTVRVARRGKAWAATAKLGGIRGDGADVGKDEAVATAIGNALSTMQTGMAPTGQSLI